MWPFKTPKLQIDTDVLAKLTPKPDITALELAHIVGLGGWKAMTKTTWDALPPEVARHFLAMTKTPN